MKSLAGLFGWMLCTVLACANPPLTLNEKRIRLGLPGAPEWEEFAADPPASTRFEVRFQAEPNAGEATLFIRQNDVKQEWTVELNGQRVGKLFLMEADLIHTISVPPGALRQGENVLSIRPPPVHDDIVLHEIRLDLRPPVEARQEAILTVTVGDRAGQPLPCRITVIDERGTLAPIIAGAGQASPPAVRPGVAYTGTGRARLGLPRGRYTVFASRGFEYGVARQSVEIAAGQLCEVNLQLVSEVSTPGFVSCDTHVHTVTHSGHGDATLDERMLTLAGEGIELPIATDHNFHADHSEPARRLGVHRYFTPVTGNEVTTRSGHFNIFPVNAGAPVPDSRITDWPALMTALRATPGVRVIVLNHPRSIHTGFRPFAPANFNAVTGENKRGAEFSFDAIELLNSGAQQTDYLLVYRDWFALLNHGYRIIGVGSSDSHDVSRFIVGQARTYLAAPEEDPSRIDVAVACQNLLEGRALVSMGLLANLIVEDKFRVGDLATGLPPEFQATVHVSGPSWVRATRVALFANGVRIREAEIPEAPGAPDRSAAAGEKARVTWTIPRPKHDVHLVAIATGPPVTAPFWAMTRPYQPTSPHWEGRVIGSTNPVWIDADGDGRFTAARGYARQLVERHGIDPGQILSALRDFDEAVAAQAASFCTAGGVKLNDASFAEALKSAAPQTALGFAKYLEAEGQSLIQVEQLP